jgi:[NiFe] hydrogenase assembly HybE family chaperone
MPAPDIIAQDRTAELVANFERIAREIMVGLPFYNEALTVEAIDFAPFGDERIGILVTPWFMNLMLIGDVAEPYGEARNGEKRVVDLPSGPQTFLRGGDESFGMFYAHSLASPLTAYVSQDQARAIARAALARLLSPPPADVSSQESSRPAAARAAPSRRTLFTFAGRPAAADPAG